MRNRWAGLFAVSVWRVCLGIWAVCDGSNAISSRDETDIRPDSGVSVRRKRTASEDLQQIVRQADQAPFALHLSKPAKQELSEAAAVFDLAERRFDDRFATSIFRAAFLRPQLACHLLFHRQMFWRSPLGNSRWLLVMFHATGRDVRFVDPLVRF